MTGATGGTTGSTGTTGTTGSTGTTGVTGAEVSAAPSGPPVPTSGWHVAYADAFGAPLGTGAGQDPTFKAGSDEFDKPVANLGCCGNADEIAIERPSQVSVTSGGLKLMCEYLTTPVAEKRYNCAGARTNEGGNGPLVSIGGGATVVFEMKGTLPPNLGTADPGFWISGAKEVDFPEFYGSGSKYVAGSGWTKTPFYFHAFGGPEPTLWGTSVKPEVGVHTWTTELRPGVGSNYVMQVWLDGTPLKLQDETTGCYSESCAREVSREFTPFTGWDHLILTYALRKGVLNEFTSGSNSFTVRSVEVLEDGAHAGLSVTGGGIAPGTTVHP